MQYYAFIENEKLNGAGQLKRLDDNVQNIEITEEVFNNISKYMYSDGDVILNPNYEAEQEQKEKERIAKLYLTGADVERGIYQAKGMDFDDILASTPRLYMSTNFVANGGSLRWCIPRRPVGMFDNHGRNC